MTPEAVVYRYLEAANREPAVLDAFVRVLGADADLLGRWLNLTGLPADPLQLTRALEALDGAELRSLAQAQAWALLPVNGSARLALDQWRSSLRAAFLGENLARAVRGADGGVRWRILLAISGVNVTGDPAVDELVAFRGSRPELLADAGLLVRVFAVVDAFEVVDEFEAAQLAQSLLQLGSDDFLEQVRLAQEAADELVAALHLTEEDEDEADWAERLWVQQQLSILTGLLQLARNPAEIHQAHVFASRSLFREVPLLLVDEGGGRFHSVDDAELVIHADSTSSEIAAVIRDRSGRVIGDHSDLSVGDRQLLRRMDTAEVVCIPVLADGRTVAVLLMNFDEEGENDFALSLYVVALGQRLGRGDGAEQPLVIAERYRQREERRLRELVHEANNPLAVVQNYLHILEMRLREEPSAAEPLSMIRTEIERVTSIIARARELPPVAEAESAESVTAAEVEVSALLRRVHELHLGYAQTHRVELKLNAPSSPLQVQSDEQRLAQILNNLVRNAVEAAADASVTLGAEAGVYRDGRAGVELLVQDTGPGLPRSVLARLAEPKESTKGGEHAGLGLAIVYRLVAELGGSLDVRTAPGEGTTFRLFVPLATRSNV